jgi:Xaa-Pro aminopeptidase
MIWFSSVCRWDASDVRASGFVGLLKRRFRMETMAKKKVPAPSPLIANRLKRFRGKMKSKKVGAFLVSKPMDYFYLTGFTGEDSAVLITGREVHAISDGRFDEAINQECPWVKRWLRKGTLNAEIGKVCKALKLKKLAVQPDGMTLEDFESVRKESRPTGLVHAPPITGTMRRLKDEAELKAMRKAIKNAEEAFKTMCAAIKVGQTELEMAARLEYEMKIRGASGPSFPTICAEGPNAALPHAFPGKRKVKKGSAILFDWGARVGMYCSDLTRMVFVGSIPSRIAEVYDIVLQAQRRAIRAIRPGLTMRAIDKVARDFITEAGYGEQFNHSLGHGLGLDVHEPPLVSWRSDEKFKAGMLVTVEPGIYLPRVGGVRIEDDVIVTPGGCRVLSRLSRSIEDAVI